ncbi:MAG TPA: prepilin-type N-terminal cleavage/methylation domain-containing protein [Longimicrobiales bacterium]
MVDPYGRRVGPIRSRTEAGHVPARRGGAGRGRAYGRREGFTVLEVLIVMVLIGILIGLARPMVDVDAYRMRATTHSVTTTLLAAQRLAVKRQYDVVVAFDTVHARLRVHEDVDSDGHMDEGEPVRMVELGEGVVFGRGGAPSRPVGGTAVTFAREQAGVPALAFHRDGSASEHGGFYLTSARAAKSGGYPADTRAFEIERSTGRTTWFRYVAASWERGF